VTLAPSIGTTCAGFGAIAVAVACRALTEQKLPARLNTSSAAGLDALATPSSARELRHILIATPSLGGQNSAAVVSRHAEL
jgi:3-oxoacyl-(acyl-carrier-protein) synthase